MKMQRTASAFVFIFLQVSGLLSHAAEIYPFFRSVRAQGMGGAAVATVDDETALFLNPAGLGKIRVGYFALLNPELEMNFDTNTALSIGYQYGALQNPQTLRTVSQANPNKRMHAHFQIQPAYVTTNFGLGGYMNYREDAEYNPSTGRFQIDYINDMGATMGFCLRLWEGRIKIGVAGKIINRVELSREYTNSETVDLPTQAKEGYGIGWDTGVLVTMPWIFLPTIGAVAHDVGNTTFKLGNGYYYKTGVYPEMQRQSIDAAFAFFPIHGNKLRSSFTAEYRDVQNPEKVDMYRRLHAGVEINFSDVFFLRGGMNQRYYTAGFEFTFARQQIQFATYGEEIGTATAFREDRRYIWQYGFRF